MPRAVDSRIGAGAHSGAIFDLAGSAGVTGSARLKLRSLGVLRVEHGQRYRTLRCVQRRIVDDRAVGRVRRHRRVLRKRRTGEACRAHADRISRLEQGERVRGLLSNGPNHHPECRLKGNDSIDLQIVFASIASRHAPNNWAASCNSRLDSPQ